MKKIGAVLLAGIIMAACNNDKTATDNNLESNPGTPGMDNVHGNIADTSDAIRLNQPLPQDSSALDSAANKDSIRR